MVIACGGRQTVMQFMRRDNTLQYLTLRIKQVSFQRNYGFYDMRHMQRGLATPRTTLGSTPIRRGMTGPRTESIIWDLQDNTARNFQRG